MEGKVYINGKIVAPERARISVFDRGFRFGDGIFETIKVSDGRAIFLGEHLERLYTSLRDIGIPVRGVKYLDDLFNTTSKGAVERLINAAADGGRDWTLRITVTRGTALGGYSPISKRGRKRGNVEAPPTVIVTITPDKRRKGASTLPVGVGAVLLNGPDLNFRLTCATPGYKSLNFLPNIIGKGIAEREGAFEGLFLDGSGGRERVVEGTSTNIFAVIDGTLITPPLVKGPGAAGPLPGITRSAVIESCRIGGMPVRERHLYTKNIPLWSEAFLTNSGIEITPLTSIDGAPVGSTSPGDITRRVYLEYKKLIRSLQGP